MNNKTENLIDIKQDIDSVNLNEELNKKTITSNHSHTKSKVSNKKDLELIRRLKIASLIITILASLGSIIYYIYSIVNGDTIFLQPADTVIIQNNDIKLKQKGNENITEQIMLDNILELQKVKGYVLDLDYFVGKVLTGSSNFYYRPLSNTVGEKITLKINRSLDVVNNRKLNDEIECVLDDINASYFQIWKQFDPEAPEIVGKIKIKDGDLLGFRFLKNNKQNICELFQVNHVNLTEFNSELNKARLEILNSNTGGTIVGMLENFSINRFGSNNTYVSGALSTRLLNESSYYNSPTHLHIINYINNDYRLPAINISCSLSYGDSIRLTDFFKKSNIDPILYKNRIQIELHKNRNFQQGIVYSKDISDNEGMAIPHETYFNGACKLKKISLMDLSMMNYIITNDF